MRLVSGLAWGGWPRRHHPDGPSHPRREGGGLGWLVGFRVLLPFVAFARKHWRSLRLGRFVDFRVLLPFVAFAWGHWWSLLDTRAFFAGHCGRLGRLGPHRLEPGLEDGACRQSTTTSRHSQSTRSSTKLGCSDAKVLRRSPSDTDSRHLDKDSGAPAVSSASTRLCVVVRLTDFLAMTWTSRQIWPGQRKSEYVTQKASKEPAGSGTRRSSSPLLHGATKR